MARRKKSPKILAGAGNSRLQPKLRMIRNGGHNVNQIRAEQAAAVALKYVPDDQGCVRGPGLVCEHTSHRRGRKKREWENVADGSAEVVVDVFIQLDDEDAKLPAELLADQDALPQKEFARQNAYGIRVRDFNQPVEGIQVTAENGAYLTAEVPLSKLDELKSSSVVTAIEIGQELKIAPPILSGRPEKDAPQPAERYATTFEHDEGKGVLIGIIDIGGFDFAHKDFLDEEGQTRFIEIWDQAGGTRLPPKPYTYGARITQQQMNNAIEAEKRPGNLPATELEPQSLRMRSSHATHVASIAAGKHGICPQAMIAGVSLALPTRDTDPRLSFYDSTRLAHAVDYLFQLGVERNVPVAINISLGTNGHAHDGTSVVNRWLEHGLSKSGRAICVAAGNAGQEAPTGPDDMGFLQGRIHSAGQIPASGLSRDLEWIVVGDGQGDLSENEIEIWYSMQDRFAVEIRPPDSEEWLGPVEPGDFIENKVLATQTVVSIYNELYAPCNGHNHISVFLSPFFSKEELVGVHPGKWTIRLHGRDIRDGSYHAWIERDDPRRIKPLEFESGWAFPSFFSKKTAVDNSSVNSLAAGHSIISVANYDSQTEQIHKTSSQGPTRDGRNKPEIAAPGTNVLAANGFDSRDRPWVSMTGTSMASPFVTGVVALMLGLDRELTAAQIAGILRRSAKPLPSSDFAWKNDAGFGVVDVDLCLREADNINKRRDQTG